MRESAANAAALSQMRREVEQLRKETRVARQPVSQCAAELIQYVQHAQSDDVLVVGFSNERYNPYRTKSSFPCNVL